MMNNRFLPLLSLSAQIIILFNALLFSTFAWASVQVISDVDDTFKIMNIENKAETVRRAFLHEAFTGMNALYRAYESEPVFVSGTPEFIRPLMTKFMKKQGFINSKVILKPKLSISTLDYKIRAISRLVQESELPVILIGDDTEYDSEAYFRVTQRYPEKILAVYI